jgi:hypothetical protein
LGIFVTLDKYVVLRKSVHQVLTILVVFDQVGTKSIEKLDEILLVDF